MRSEQNGKEMASFEIAFHNTMAHEGGYVDDPADLGGETYCGISRKYHPDWAGWQYIDQLKLRYPRDFKARLKNDTNLRDAVEGFYFENYWNVNRLDEVEYQPIATEIYDTGVNCGTETAAIFLQQSLNVLNRNQKDYPDLKVDGQIGPVTLRTLNAHKFPERVLKCLNIYQGSRYLGIVGKNPLQERFLGGWLNRVVMAALLICLMTACGASREARRSNRAAKLVEKAKILDPAIIQGDTILLPVTLTAPEILGHIESNVPALPEEAKKTDLPPTKLADEHLEATVSMVNGRMRIDYKIKEKEVKGSAHVVQNKIEPTRVEKLNFWEKVNSLVVFFFWVLVIVLAMWLARKIFKI